jgi:hypothetical protein
MTSSSNEAAAAMETETGEPVDGFPLKFKWYKGVWQKIFDKQIELLKNDVARAQLDGRLVLYLSCPVTGRGGGYSGTNVDIARYTERKILERWGEDFWVLNPAQYQLESKAGKGLLDQHAKDLELDIDLTQLQSVAPPGGGDYMRMWTKVLVEHDEDGKLGRNFDAYYFLGPRDVFSFFTENGSQSMTAGIQAYFARKISTDAAFRDYFSIPDIAWGDIDEAKSAPELRTKWSELRRDFLRFYGLRASANFSLGSHDEWAILRLVNEARRKQSEAPDKLDGDVGDQLAAFFDGVQVSLSASEAPVSRGYAV